MTRALAVVTVLFACSSKPPVAEQAAPAPEPAPAPAPITAREPACDTRVSTLGTQLQALAAQKPGMLPTVLPAGVELATAPAARTVDAPGVVAVITKDDQVTAAGNTVALAAASRLIDEAFWRRAKEAAAMERAPKSPWPLYVWADKRTKLTSVAALVGDMTKDFRVRVLVTGDPATPDPHLLATPSVKQVHDATPTTDEAALIYLAQKLRSSSEGCDSLPMALGVRSTEGGPVREPELFATEVPKALLACECTLADWDLFAYGMNVILGAFHPTPKYIDLPAIKAGDKRTVADLAAATR